MAAFRYQNQNPAIEKEARKEEKVKLKSEIQAYKRHLESLRKEKEEDVASSDMAKFFGGNAAAEQKNRSLKRKAAKEAARLAKEVRLAAKTPEGASASAAAADAGSKSE